MNKFLLAENPMRPDDDGLFIFHMLEPKAIIQVHDDHLYFQPGKYYKHFDFEGCQYTLSIHFLFTGELDSEQHNKIVERILNRAWRWYRSYVELEDKQHDQ